MNNDNPQTIYLKNYQIPDFQIDHVDLTFELEEECATVTSQLQIKRDCFNKNQHAPLILQGEELELCSIQLNDKLLSPADYQVDATSLTILSVPNEFTLQIKVRNKPQENTALSGLYKSSGNFCTQCEAQGFRRITYFLDRPDVMATYNTTIIADEKRYPHLLSNGNRIAAAQLPNGKHTVTWQDPFKKPSYLFALVAGNFEYLEDIFITTSQHEVLIQVYVEKGNLNKAYHALAAVKKAMRWEEEVYGREYDLDNYMIVAVSDFNMGAMENKGLNIFNTKYVLAKPDTATDLDYIQIESVIAHEYFHNWTGNRITCRDWFQLSLKEGLTVFRDQCFTADTTSDAVARIKDVNYLRTSQFPEDAGPLAHPVRPQSYIEINNFYTSTVYNKGAEVIRMLKTIVGDKLFRKGMDCYFTRHDGQAVTIEEFVRAHEDTSGIDLTQFRLWYDQAGTPTLHVKEQYDASNQVYALTFHQTCPATPGQPEKKPFHIPVKLGLLAPDGSEILQQVLHVKSAEQTFTFNHIPNKPVASLLRSFSAPVKLKFNYSKDDLAHLFLNDSDGFNRWEAGQQYSILLLKNLIQDYQQGKALTVSNDFSQLLKNVIGKMQHEKWLLSEMLILPSEKYLAEQMDIIDVDAIYAARAHLEKTIAEHLREDFTTIYNRLHSTKAYEFTLQAVGERYLKNVCLMYLAYFDPALAVTQFEQALAGNMTDAFASLRILSNLECSQREGALTTFYTKWQSDPLVVDKWLTLQASAKLNGTLERVKSLVKHQAFDIKNPNKVYALIGAFGHNLLYFHQKNGDGYHFLADIVLQLNAINPQVAARMVKPLTDWKRYDTMRQQLMREQLELLAGNKNLCKDVYELVSKSL